VKNQAEIITTIRASSLLARDLRKLDYASELLRFEDSTPVKAPLSLGYSRVSRMQVAAGNCMWVRAHMARGFFWCCHFSPEKMHPKQQKLRVCLDETAPP